MNRNMKVNLAVMNTPMVKNTYDVQVNNRFVALKLLNKDPFPNEPFKVFKVAVSTTVGEILGTTPNNSRKP